ncbi:MAG: molybdopterin-dependent oxidoreductase [Nocardioides sp.]
MTGLATDVSAPPTHTPQSRWRWPLVGLLIGFAGLATSTGVALALDIDHSPVVAVADAVIRITPGGISHFLIELVGTYDKLLLVIGTLILSAALYAGLGVLARRSHTLALGGFVLISGVGAAAVISEPRYEVRDLAPVVIGFITWVIGLAVLRPAAEAAGRRRFLLTSTAVFGVGVVAYGFGQMIGQGRAKVEAARDALMLAVTSPRAPAGTDFGLGQPWQTPNDDFYRIDTSLVPPAVDPATWTLRIHGLVDNPLEITFDDLTGRTLTEAWITLNCVSNEVGGDLIGNAWWSGVRLAEVLAEAGVQDGADAVLQTSHDGWTCVTPLSALTDDRNAILAVAMNGEPLTIEHGFPVRAVVPGLYGYVSATKWVVEMKVTTFAEDEGYWTSRGWTALGPNKLASRIDVPTAGDTVGAGPVTIAGTAWRQGVGVKSVEVSVDGGPWTAADLAATPNVDTWVQWRTDVDLAPGSHIVRVRATDETGFTQSGVELPPAPNGSEGWHTVEFAVM